MPDYYICHPIQTGTTPLCFVFAFGPRYLELGYFVFPVFTNSKRWICLSFFSHLLPSFRNSVSLVLKLTLVILNSARVELKNKQQNDVKTC